MNSDTVVGVVGAVLLVTVMVGVFVYEYNNPMVATPGGAGADPRAAFHSRFPQLSPGGDLDGDGTPNLNDTDLDGDGIMNGNDTVVAVTLPFSGTMAAQGPPASGGAPQSFRFQVEPNMTALHVVLFYNSTTASPLPPSPGLQVELVGPDGRVVRTAQGPAPPAGSGAYVKEIGVAESLPPGSYSVRVASATPGPSTAFTGRTTVTY